MQFGKTILKWNNYKCCLCKFVIFSYVLFDITKVQKKGGKSWNDPSLYLAPESDEWEEIDCDEAI